MRFLVTYKDPAIPPRTIEADFLKFDHGVALLIIEIPSKRLVAIINTELVRDIVTEEIPK